MSTEDPFAIVDPTATIPLTSTPLEPVDDPFAIITPRSAVPDFSIVESVADNERDEAPIPNFLDLFGTIARWQILDVASGAPDITSPEAAASRDKLIGYGQSIREAFAESRDPRGKFLTQVVEETTRVPSSLAEQLGTIFSDLTGTEEENNMLYQFGRVLRESTRTPDLELADETLTDDVVRGFTQAIGFIAGGKGLATLLDKGTKAAAGIAAWMGAAVGGQAGREDAKRHGANDAQVDVAYYVNSVFGLTEGLPVSVALGRLDDMTGGIISKHIRNEAGQLIYGTVIGGITEGLQEAVQTFGENWTADELAAYDPGRPWTENLLYAAGLGGGIGSTITLLMSAFGIRNRRAAMARIKENILDPIGAASIDEIAGPLTVLPDGYYQLLAQAERESEIIRIQGLEDPDLEVKFGEERAQAVQDVGALPMVGAGTQESQTREDLLRSLREGSITPAAQARRDAVLSAPLNESTEGKNKTLPERMQEGEKVIMALTQVRVEAEPLIEQYEKHILGLLRIEADTKLTAEQQGLLNDAKLKVKGLKGMIAAEEKLARELKALAEDLRYLVGEDIILAINNNYHTAIKAGRSITGTFLPVRLGKAGSLIVDSLLLNTSEYFEAIYDSIVHKGDPTNVNVRKMRAAVLGSFMHEFGHAIAYNQFQDLIHKIVDGTATDEQRDTYKGIRNDYMRFVAENLNQPREAVIKAMMALPRGVNWLQDIAGIWGDDSLLASAMKMSYIPFDGKTLTQDVSADTINYLFSFVEYFAEEFSKLGTGQTLGTVDILDTSSTKFIRGIFKDINEALAVSQGHFKSSSPTLEAYYRRHSIRAQLREIQEAMQAVEHNPLVAIAKEGILSKELADSLGEGIDKFNKFMDIGFNILQIAEQNPHIQGLQNYVQRLDAWKNEVNNNLKIAEDRLKQWKNLGDTEIESLARLLTDQTVGRLPDGGWLKDPRYFTEEELAKYGLSEEAIALFEDIKKDLLHSLNEMEQVLIAAKMRIFSEDIIEATKQVASVKKEFKEMRNRPYFPLMRFGEYVYQIRAVGDQVVDGREYKDGNIIDTQSFDTKKERDKGLVLARKQYVSSKIIGSSSKLVVPNFSLQGMPLTLLDHLESKLTSVGISDEVRQAIQAVKNDVLPFKSFRKQFQRRKRVEGYSLDAQRSYANYMSSFANHIARVKFDHLFKEDFENIENSIKAQQKEEGTNTDKRASILNHMNQHLEYVMNPVNEFVGLRSAAFFWFLGFNIKSAFVNSTQVALVTYPYLAARYGDARAVAQITRAGGTAIRAMTNPDVVDPELMSMIEQGLSETWLDESLATELALAASEKNLDKTLPRKWRQKAWLKVSQWGSLPFHTVEKFNRHLTAIAAYRLERSDKSKDHKAGVDAARQAVRKTQYEYARWARPRFMRGKVGGTVFVFQNFMQNSLYFALGGDPGAFRMMVMLFLMAGLQGLPFGENIMDLVDAAMSALKKHTGVKDPHTQVRVDLRKMLEELNVDPDLILHGMASSTFGLANIGEFMGWPIPDVDLSGSLSMGRIIPGTELLAPGQTATFERASSGAITRAGGAITSAFAGVGQAIFNAHPDTWKRWEKAMPAAMRQISKAARMSMRGGEATRGDEPIAELNWHDTKEFGELVLQGLGFTPRELSRGWEGFIAKQQSVIFYETWRTSLLKQWNYSKYTRNQEAVKEANKEIKEYNSIVPFNEMRIGTDSRIASWESYRRSHKLNERKIEQSKPFRRLSDSIEAVFEEDSNEDKN